jgi:hypothetical protein
MSNEKLTVLKGGMLRYRYVAGGCMEFDFHMLCEVGEPYQPWFREEIERRGWEVEYGREMDEPPWVADFVLKDRPKGEANINYMPKGRRRIT